MKKIPSRSYTRGERERCLLSSPSHPCLPTMLLLLLTQVISFPIHVRTMPPWALALGPNKKTPFSSTAVATTHKTCLLSLVPNAHNFSLSHQEKDQPSQKPKTTYIRRFPTFSFSFPWPLTKSLFYRRVISRKRREKVATSGAASGRGRRGGEKNRRLLLLLLSPPSTKNLR